MNIVQPKPQSKQYTDLIRDIENGTLKIPQFQRDFVWDIDKTAELLDSILKGYPIGTFIIWQTKDRINNIKNIGNQELPETMEGTEVHYILDGQQRITSLFAAYKGVTVPSKDKKKPIEFNDIVVNLDADINNTDEQIVIPKPKSGKYLSLNEVLHFSYTKSLELPEEFDNSDKAKIDLYSKAFDKYDFSTVYLRKDDIESAIEVFTRINTSGKTLTLFEIMSAKTYDEKQNFDMQQKWDDFLKDLNVIGYDEISSSNILNLLSVILSKTKECKRSVTLSLDKQDIINHWDKAISAVQDAVEHFQKFFKIPVARLLPYDTLIVPFAYFFYNVTDYPSTLQKRLLEEFFWRMSLSHRYSSSSETSISQDVRRIDEIIKEVRPNYSDIQVELNKDKDLINTTFTTSDSFCKAILCLLANFAPKDFHTNQPVTLDNSWLKVSSSKNYHHIFPKNFLSKNNVKNDNSLVNITFVSDKLNKTKIRSRAPSDYFSEFAKNNEELEETLLSHLIDDIDSFGITTDDYSKFLEKRAQRIYLEIKERMKIPGKEVKNIKEIEKIIANGESDTIEFKSTLRYDLKTKAVSKIIQNQIIKSVAAFLNSNREGELLIGVSDQGDILGLDDDLQTFSTKRNLDGFELHLINLLKENFGSLVSSNVKITFPSVDSRSICRIKVKPSGRPVFIVIEGKELFFVRMGNSSHPLSPRDQSDYEKTRWQS